MPERRRNRIRTIDSDQNFTVALNDGGIFQDAYHKLLSCPWPTFFALVGLAYFCVNLVFAWAYFLCGPQALEGVQTSSPFEHFLACFFFSVQTLATIGYGRMSPIDLIPNLLVAVEAFVGLLGLALITGLFFARFSRPRSRVVFSKNAVIREFQGQNVLMVRVANERLNRIAEAHVDVALVRLEVLPDGERFRNMIDLKLKRRRSPMFAITWTIVHPIDHESPLYGLSPEDLEKIEAEIVISLSGLDETLAQSIHARYSYEAKDILWNAKFVDMLSESEGKFHVDLSKIHDIAS